MRFEKAVKAVFSIVVIMSLLSGSVAYACWPLPVGRRFGGVGINNAQSYMCPVDPNWLRAQIVSDMSGLGREIAENNTARVAIDGLIAYIEQYLRNCNPPGSGMQADQLESELNLLRTRVDANGAKLDSLYENVTGAILRNFNNGFYCTAFQQLNDERNRYHTDPVPVQEIGFFYSQLGDGGVLWTQVRDAVQACPCRLPTGIPGEGHAE